MEQRAVILIVCFGFLLGCAPSGSGSSGQEALAPHLLERPEGIQPNVISRELPFSTDERISYCEILGAEKDSYSGFRDQKPYPLASISKLFTTAWALHVLGPDFEFESIWHLQAVPQQAGVFDAYLRTGYDPVFNIEKVLYSLSKLNDSGVKRIRKLVVDESTRVFLSALSQPHIELDQVPISSSETISNLRLILNSDNWSSQTQMARQNLMVWAVEKDRPLSIPSVFSVENVELKKSNAIDMDLYSQKVVVRSAPLLKYLKNLNVYSNNYVSDALFSYLGGAQSFKTFQNTQLKISDSNLQLRTGSGLADFSSGVRQDNRGTCVSVLKILNYIDIKASEKQLNLGHLLYNPSDDIDGTLESDLVFRNNVVLKTGRLFEKPAFNLAGIVATAKGSFYFSFLGHDFTPEEADQIETARETLLGSALNYYPTQPLYLSSSHLNILIK